MLDNNGVKGGMAMEPDPDRWNWTCKGVIADISQKPFSVTFVGLKMLDGLCRTRNSRLTMRTRPRTAFARPDIRDSGSSLVEQEQRGSVCGTQKSVISTPGVRRIN